MKIKKYYNTQQLLLLSAILLTVAPSCKKIIEIGNPKTEVAASQVFSSDPAAVAGMVGIYADMRGSWAGGSYNSVSAKVSLSADEMDGSGEYFSNALIPASSDYFWGPVYKDIYAANAMLQGLAKPNGLTPAINTQLTGEAKFVRAFCYFYLVNFYGDVPLVTGTDWQQNTMVTRTPKQQVYNQIIADLKDAQTALPATYTGAKRSRPIKWAATALLARVYLYTQQWADAETQASAVIANTSLYSLPALNQVFLITSKEAIWQISNDTNVAEDSQIFSPNPAPPYNSPLLASTAAKFSTNDLRVVNWITKIGTSYFPTKYKDNISSDGITEYSMVMRLAEQYLIRAEARAQLDKVTGTGSAQADVDAIRTRAGLAGTTATTKTDILLAIEDERLRELYTEWGHRWLDLKRTGRAVAVLKPLKPAFTSTRELFPIPQAQINNDPAMAGQQNPGYN
jgi:hypothetical protein